MPWHQASRLRRARTQPEELTGDKEAPWRLTTPSSISQSVFPETHFCILLIQTTTPKQLVGSVPRKHLPFSMRSVGVSQSPWLSRAPSTPWVGTQWAALCPDHRTPAWGWPRTAFLDAHPEGARLQGTQTPRTVARGPSFCLSGGSTHGFHTALPQVPMMLRPLPCPQELPSPCWPFTLNQKSSPSRTSLTS